MTVNEISIDSSGDWVASCSEDGQLFINNLYTDEFERFEFSRPVKSVALDPNYGKKGGTKQFLTGGKEGILSLHTKGWFKEKETIIHQGEGPIYLIRWSGCAFLCFILLDCKRSNKTTSATRPSKKVPFLQTVSVCKRLLLLLLLLCIDSTVHCDMFG